MIYWKIASVKALRVQSVGVFPYEEHREKPDDVSVSEGNRPAAGQRWGWVSALQQSLMALLGLRAAAEEQIISL